MGPPSKTLAVTLLFFTLAKKIHKILQWNVGGKHSCIGRKHINPEDEVAQSVSQSELLTVAKRYNKNKLVLQLFKNDPVKLVPNYIQRNHSQSSL